MFQTICASDLGRWSPRRRRHVGPVLTLALLLALLVPAGPAGSSRTADRIVAIVNNEVITLSDIKAEVGGEEAHLRRQYQGEEFDLRLEQLQYKALSRLIERKLQIQFAKERGYEPTEEEVRQAIRNIQRQGDPVDADDPKFQATIKEQLTVLRVLQSEVNSGVTVTEEEMERYYEEHRTHFMLPIEYRLSQILLRPDADETPQAARRRAMKVHAQLARGADFASLARRTSDGGEAPQGGSLGSMRADELEPPIERAIAKLEPGQVTDPIKTDDGFHIVRMDARQPPKYRQYAQVRGQIQGLVYKQKSDDQYHKWIDGLKDKAYIEVKF